jgi:hypothetical protein
MQITQRGRTRLLPLLRPTIVAGPQGMKLGAPLFRLRSGQALGAVILSEVESLP